MKNNFLITTLFITSILSSNNILAEDTNSTSTAEGSTLSTVQTTRVYPAAILTLDKFYTHHVLIAEKSTHLLHLFKNNSGYPELVKSYPMVTGKKSGDKSNEGDFKTPEGIYSFSNFMDHKELMQKNGSQGIIYGAGAFVTNYPNPVDQRMKKSGSGIWLHSTNDETRLDKGLDSKGCVVTANADLIDVSKFIELDKTPMVIVQDLIYLNEKTHEMQTKELEKTIQGWILAWKNKDIERYMSHYHPALFIDTKGNFAKYKAYKKAVFSNPGKYAIDIDNISILQSKDYAVVTFTQKYKSSTINDIGHKELYLKQDENYSWKIVNETWTKNGLNGLDNKIAFEPSLRFFKAEQEKNQGND